MDVMATRGWGIAVSGAMIVAALWVAFSAQDRAPAGPVAHAPIVDAPHVSGAQAEPRASATMIVHFRGHGPLARAERARSTRRVRAELLRQRAFHGLCFERFAARGVVLSACDGGMLTAWPQRLRAMRAVAKVDAGE